MSERWNFSIYFLSFSALTLVKEMFPSIQKPASCPSEADVGDKEMRKAISWLLVWLDDRVFDMLTGFVLAVVVYSLCKKIEELLTHERFRCVWAAWLGFSMQSLLKQKSEDLLRCKRFWFSLMVSSIQLFIFLLLEIVQMLTAWVFLDLRDCQVWKREKITTSDSF